MLARPQLEQVTWQQCLSVLPVSCAVRAPSRPPRERSRCFLGEHSGGVQVWPRNRAACIQFLALPMSHKVSRVPSSDVRVMGTLGPLD